MEGSATTPESHVGPRSSHRSLPAVLSCLFWAFGFGLSYTQVPLYYSNQNQYFLHGLAQSDRGLLKEDWLANTADPTPVFTRVVELTNRYLHEAFFYLYYLLLLGIY